MRPRIDREAARARILKTANRLFRKFGHVKTTVADIAAELGMSPANIYKFFPARDAIVEACVEINLARLQTSIIEAVEQKRRPVDKLEALVLAFIQDHKTAFRNERHLYELVILATEKKWPSVQRFFDWVVALLASIVEDGNRAQDFHAANVKEVAQSLFDGLQCVINPLLTQDIEQQILKRKARSLIRLLVKALR